MVFHLVCYYMLSLQCVIFVYRHKEEKINHFFRVRNEIFGLRTHKVMCSSVAD